MSFNSLFDATSYFETVSEVSESWDLVKNTPNHSEILGTHLFRRMYETAPNDVIWKAYSFSREDVEEKSEKFLVFAKRFTRMLDVAVSMLGPDLDTLQEAMYDLGAMHERYEVMPHHYDLMGEALVYALEHVLEPHHYTPATKKAWKELYAFMAENMMEGASDLW
ncbi:Globin [Seminavis robusta]|uniref:Globin n=1 Tax=Seminavis robusta TaxID=568900 RepID=A0A9N8E6G3_9STRA|nr:Globin [Seminavis robusta]|eukprot:Sro547_g164240.1 Globin (165) ;mRNA; r:34386-34964